MDHLACKHSLISAVYFWKHLCTRLWSFLSKKKRNYSPCPLNHGRMPAMVQREVARPPAAQSASPKEGKRPLEPFGGRWVTHWGWLVTLACGGALLHRPPSFLPAPRSSSRPGWTVWVKQGRKKKKKFNRSFLQRFFAARLCLWLAGNGLPWHLHPTAFRDGTPN